MSKLKSVADWFDERTGYRAGLHHMLDEPLPASVNWWFTLGSILLFLLSIQVATGGVLMMYYVPTPTHAYDSIRFITTQLAFGSMLRGLHFFGASFIVVAAGLHLLRVLFFGSYKSPREVTWWTGIVLLLVIMGFALTGYLLPWDQRAYWATVVTINIAKSTPIAGDMLANIMRGGPDIGALTLSRWFAVHVVLLPAALISLTVLHLYLMRRHGISGHFKKKEGAPVRFFPNHAIKDTLLVALVFAALFSFAAFTKAPLEAMADPSDANYTPRPEWYFLSLFQLLKYFPGKLEPLAAHGIPGLTILLLFALPFLDRGLKRHPFERKAVTFTAGFIVLGALTLMTLGLRDTPHNEDPNVWGIRALGGRAIAMSDTCARCHQPGGAGPDFARGKVARDDVWIAAHVADPEMIAPGSRPAPADGQNTMGQKAIVAYAKKIRAGAETPKMTPEETLASGVFVTKCIQCHVYEGDGGKEGPDLTHAAKKADRTAAWLKRWITDPSDIDSTSDMPAFGGKITPAEMDAISNWLATKK